MDWGNLPFSLQLLVFDSTQQVLSSPADPPSSFPFLILSYTPATWVLLCSFYLVGTTAYCVGQSKRIRLPADGDTECSGALQRIRHFAAIFEVFVREQDILEVELESEDGEEVLSTVDLEALLPPQPITLRLLPLAEALGWITWSVWLAFLAASTRSQSSCSVLLLSGVSSLSWALVFLKELLRPSRLPPYDLLVFLILQSLSSGVSLAQYLHKYSSASHPSPHALLLAARRVPDLACCISLIFVVLEMPSRAPLGSVIRDKARSRADPRPSSPEDSNTLLGSLTYSWMGSIMSLAQTRPLLPSDVWALSLTNRAEVLSRRFSALKEETLLGRILHASARDIAIDFSLKLVAVSLNYLRPYWIQRILESLALSAPSLSSTPAPWTPHQQAYIFALLAFASMALSSLAQLQHFHHARRIGMRLRSELTVAVFEKALRRKDMRGRTEGSACTGRVVSLVSEDTNRILRMGCDSHLIYGAPLEISLALLFLYNLMGWSAFVGFAILVVAVPLNYSLGKQSIQITRARSAARDARQASLQELISSIRTIKFFGWSDAWIEKTQAKRSTELHWVVQEWLNRFYLTVLWALISLVVPLASFFFFVKIQQKELTVAIAFTALALFSMVRGPLNQVPEFGIRVLQTQVSIARIESFFHEEEVASHARPAERAASGLAFHDATFARHSSGSEPNLALQDLDIAFPAGLTLVSGPTGSGKTSLLLALLGELEVVSGAVDLPAAVSYAAQHPWLESASICANILFGTPYDRERYQATLFACALLPDLAMLSGGDSTHIGERGVSLSGGQKARIALARAIYAPTTHLLLDDVLSAVDSHTARHILDHAFGGSLLRGRTCVLVTHHIELVLRRASYRVDLCDGKVISQGPVAVVESATAGKQVVGDSSGVEDEPVASDGGAIPGTTTEGWTTGEVKTSIFATYLKASSYALWFILLVLILARPPLSFLEQFWLRLWGEAYDSRENVDYYLEGYALIGASSALVLLLSTAVLYAASLRASRTIFSELLRRVVRCPPRWFDITPQGRITNRFTNDISMVDEALAGNFSSFAIHLSGVAAALVVTTIILPAAFVPTACFALVYAIYFGRYLAVNRSLNRIAATTASPIFSGFQEVLVGITTIRAYARETAYRADLCALIDETLALWYASCTLDVWLSIRTQLLSASCLLGTASFAIYTRTSPGLSGIAITSSTAIITSLDWLCNAYGRLVMGLNSMERISEYLELEPESLSGIVPPATWPSSGSSGSLIKVRDLVIKYSPELTPVLRGISFSILPRERIAIAGRTGSGKSTLAMSFLRFVDPSEGEIIIDGLDITTIALEELRRRITFLPQEAVLFSGSVRDNLDPFLLHSDEECWDALHRVHLTSSGSGSRNPVYFDPLGEGDESRGAAGESVSLATQVSAGGSNFSAGQRQLLALARALLRGSSIIIFDESTAAIDFRLDAIVQATIRTEFQDACLITIAHRLRTIVDYDKVLVLEGGRVLEFDTPAALLARDSAFREMCRQSGDYEELVAIARNAKS